jgi:hypothetical protein
MKSKFFIPAAILVLTLSCKSHETKQTITSDNLLGEMIDLNRLTVLPESSYKTFQFSSYDRRSTSPADSLWFSNEDGFGGEPIPGFEKILREPDSTGIGEYLICDIKGPGVIQRLWSAGITGKIRLFLDDSVSPVYEGDAQPLFNNILTALTGSEIELDIIGSIRQFDATYFPVQFSKSCRIEWTGSIRELHFYHFGVRIYKNDVKVLAFNKDDLLHIKDKLNGVIHSLKNQDENNASDNKIKHSETIIPRGRKAIILSEEGEKAIDYLSIKLKAKDIENVLRKCLLTISFDNSSVPQVQSPVGDFFGAAPGLNPYISLPFSVQEDGTMTCRFIMPFRKKATLEISNNSSEDVTLSIGARIRDNEWINGKTMHFRAGWRIDHGLTASYFGAASNSISDILYLMAIGKGRIVGASAYLYNPSNAVTSWGNWWGEGDEKIFVDNDIFPSFYGTGSEDYFNYSWSSARIFSYPYCGQPRNDGPGNRGYVSNYRWHISDDILFNNNIAFYMELGNHGIVPGFSYGRIVYYYALPGVIDDIKAISEDEIRDIEYTLWSPKAYLGSAGFRFLQAENIPVTGRGLNTVKDNLCAEGKMLVWDPASVGEEVTFSLTLPKAVENRNIGFTLAHLPGGGKISVLLNGEKVKIDGAEMVDLSTPGYRILDNHFTEKVNLRTGVNKITLRSEKGSSGTKTGIDFIWVKY